MDAKGLPNPAAILLNWSGWREKWIEPPRTLEPFEAFDLQDLDSFWSPPLIPEKFHQVDLLQNTRSYVFEISLQEERLLLEYLRRVINDLPSEQRWAHPFTSCLLPTDQPQDYAWSGQLEKLPLPYEIDYTPRSLLPEPEKAQPTSVPLVLEPDSKTSDSKPEVESKKPQTQTAAILKKAPRVEIPEEYDKSKRKRPKRRFGQREFSRSINIAIAGCALICIALLVFFVQSHKSSTIINPDLDADKQVAQSLQARQDVWQRFADAGYPRAQLESARATAAFLEKAGEDTPAQIIDFLDALSTPNASALQNGLSVPKHLIQTEQGIHKLPISSVSYPAIRQLALLPTPLLQSWNLPSVAQNTEQSGSPLSLLPATSFSPQSLSDSLEAYQLRADTGFQALPASTLNSLQEYFSQKREILANPQFAPILSIHEPFGLGPEYAFLGFDEQGLLIPGSPMTLARHLNELIAAFLVHSSDLALQSSAFRQTLTVAQKQTSAPEVANTIHQAFMRLDLSSRSSSDALLRVRTLWETAFIRTDLMEQTILGYTLEALETAKLELTQIRSQFSQNDLALYTESRNRNAQIEALKEAAAKANSSKEWIVISKQSPKLRRSQP